MAIHHIAFGINYQRTASELAGCIPDARNLYAAFRKHCRTSTLRIEKQCADREAMLKAARTVRHRLQPGDGMVITLSCHGTWERTNDPTEPSGGNQGIVALDHSIIWDDEMAAECADREKDTWIFAILDCCHPGSMHRTMRKPRCVPISRCHKHSHAKSGLQMRSLPGCFGFHGAGDGPQDYCYDAFFRGPEGAMSHYTETARKRLRRGMTYRQWFQLVGGKRPRGYLPSLDYPQTPVRVGTDKYLDMPVPFIG